MTRSKNAIGFPWHLPHTARVEGQPVGMLCSFVEQAGFAPPMITLALAPDRPISPALVPGGLFGLHILGKSNSEVSNQPYVFVRSWW